MANSKSLLSTIRLSADFEKLSKSRRRINLKPWLFAKILDNPNGTRVGWSLSRSVGGAVTRNRIKRWLRNYLARNAENLSGIGLDISLVFVGRPGNDLKALKRQELEFELERLFKILKKV